MTGMANMTPTYLVDALADEAALAEALGYYKVKVPPAPNRLTLLYPTLRDTSGARSPHSLPPWRRNWEAGGRLIARFGLSLQMDENSVTAHTADRAHGGRAELAEHPDKDLAILAAIVGAARSCAQAKRST